MSLEILQIKAGQADNFSYLIFSPTTSSGIAVDPSFGPEDLLAAAQERHVVIEILVDTHGHRDHVAGNELILRETGAKLAAHPLDIPEADLPLKDGTRLSLGEDIVEILHTPGHTRGSITLNPPGALITGDTLFVTFVGRADLSGSDPTALYHSLRRLAAFAPETVVYPGHDYGPRPTSTIGFERENNPYLQCSDLESFLKLRMG